MDKFFINIASEEIKKEKQIARKLKKTSWWRRKVSKGKCYYCGKQTQIKDLTMDHIIPLARGGKSIKSNIVPCCKECNNKKKYLLPFEWDKYIKEFNCSDSEKFS